MNSRIRAYLSLRSPYSWLACLRLGRLDPGLDPDIVPIFPPPEFASSAAFSPTKLDYMREDVARIAGAYGLDARWPEPFDTDWLAPHAVVLHACDQGRGLAFLIEAGSLRFVAGADLGQPEVMREAGRRAGLQPESCVAAMSSRELQTRVLEGLRAARRDKVFGVPFLVYGGQRYWGNDRLEWLLRAVARDRGQSVPDLGANPWASPAASIPG